MALDDCVIFGIHTTSGFLKDVVNHPEFRAGRATTSFIGRFFPSWGTGEGEEERRRLALAAAAYDAQAKRTGPKGVPGQGAKKDILTPWTTLGRWRSGGET